MTYILVNHLREVNEIEPTFVAIGSFDGVHLGHQEVLKKMVDAAQQKGVRTAVLTFFPHPKRVLLNLKDRYYLSTLSERVALLAELGIDLIITQPFNEEVRHTRASDFVDQLLQYLNMRELWGGNFALGYKREGNIDFLSRLGQEKGYFVKLVNSMIELDGALVSSSRVRQSLRAGNMEDVRRCLNRLYSISGTVIIGDQRGRTIGFPTANVEEWKEQLLPANGVYATYAWIKGERFIAATNVGVRPTISGENISIETHVLQFSGDLYGENITLEFISRVRPENKFSGLDALKNQINADVEEIRQMLSPSD